MLVVAAVAALALVVPTPAAAAPGTPGVPSPAGVVYDEDFENGPAVSPILRLNQYTGAGGQTYTADPTWLVNCNGWIAGAQQPLNPPTQVADCVGFQGSWNAVQQMSQALGVLHGQSMAQAAANHAVSAYTGAALAPGQRLEFATTSNVPLPTSSRFLAFSVDVAAMNCSLAHPLLAFALVRPDGQETPVGSQIDGCASPRTVSVPALGAAAAHVVTVGTYTTNSAVLFTGGSVGIRMRNNQTADSGNDHAFDGIRILDATPQLDKEFVGGWARTGGTARLRFTVTNTDELGAKAGWSFHDALPAGLTVAAEANARTDCPGGTLTASGSDVSMTGDLTVGMVSCTVEVDVTASATGAYVNGPDRVTVTGLNPPASAAVTFSSPDIALTKTAGTPVDVNGDGLVDAGDTIPYSFEVHNDGDVPLTDVTVTDPRLPGLVCPAQLAVGATASCSADYTITAADEAAGAVVNTAVAHGTAPAPGPVVTSPPASTTTAVTAPAPGLRLVKSAAPQDLVDGETVTYTFVIDNTGNLPLSDVGVTELQFTGSGALSPIDCPSTTLPVGGELECTASYTVTAADLIAGTVDNTAAAHGLPPGTGAIPVTSATSTVELPSPAAPALEATKVATPQVVHAAGDTVHFAVTVANTGNIGVDTLTIDESGFGGSGQLDPLHCARTVLAPGAHTVCTADYRATQADIDRGSIPNTASATGRIADGSPVASPPTTTTVTVDAVGSLALTKTASAPAVVAVGQVLRYDFGVRNTGALTVHGLSVADAPVAPSAGLAAPPDCPSTTVAPGDTVTCTGTYTVTQADIDHGTLGDVAVATGVLPSGGTVGSRPAPLVLPVTAASALAVTKSADTPSIHRAGQVIGYTFHVANTGATTITDVAVSDTPTAPGGDLASPPDCATTTLAPGAETDCTGRYTVTQADIDHGSLTDTARATGTDGRGDTVASPPARLRLPSTATATIALAPQPTPNSTTVGQVVPFRFVATNTGDVTIEAVTLETDGGEPVTCEPATLGPGESAVCVVTRTVTQEDLDAGTIGVTATATGTTPAGEPVESSAVQEAVPVDGQVASLALTKSATASSTVVGQSILYTFTVRNTGTVTLIGLVVVDRQQAPAGALAAPPVCETTRLAPGESTLCRASYVPTPADLAAGSVTDSAVARAATTRGDPVESAPATLTVAVTPVAAAEADDAGPSAAVGLASTGSEAAPFLVLGLAGLGFGLLLRLSRRRGRS